MRSSVGCFEYMESLSAPDNEMAPKNNKVKGKSASRSFRVLNVKLIKMISTLKVLKDLDKHFTILFHF